MENTKHFILDYDFDGNIDKFIIALQNGEATSYNNMPFPISNAYSQGKQIVLPLWHKNIVIDLTEAYKILKKILVTKITMNIQR